MGVLQEACQGHRTFLPFWNSSPRFYQPPPPPPPPPPPENPPPPEPDDDEVLEAILEERLFIDLVKLSASKDPTLVPTYQTGAWLAR